jgi:uncharacterized phage protein (TIGR01671 family)
MRTIKFRAKLALGGKWLYGSLLRLPDGRYTIYTPDKEASTSCPVIRPDTIGQFTGLRDADGKEIYEGDVIESGQGIRHCIKYDDTQAQFIACGKHSVECGVNDTWIARFHKRVIGNIHDNPELLEKFE